MLIVVVVVMLIPVIRKLMLLIFVLLLNLQHLVKHRSHTNTLQILLLTLNYVVQCIDRNAIT